MATDMVACRFLVSYQLQGSRRWQTMFQGRLRELCSGSKNQNLLYTDALHSVAHR